MAARTWALRARASADDRWSCDISVSFPCAPGAGASRGMDPVPSIARAGRRPRLPEPRQSIAGSRCVQTFFRGLPRDSVHVLSGYSGHLGGHRRGAANRRWRTTPARSSSGAGSAGRRSRTTSPSRGWTDIVLVERAELTSRLDLPLRRSRRPAAQLGDADQDDDVRRRLYRAARGRDRHRPGVARGRLAPPRVDTGAR